ncbi:MAG: hypothetical protein WAT19_08555 [Ferruginibacter sp.]
MKKINTSAKLFAGALVFSVLIFGSGCKKSEVSPVSDAKSTTTSNTNSGGSQGGHNCNHNNNNNGGQ